jgi:hypothetical protein
MHTLSDAVMEVIQRTVAHALTYQQVVRKDVERLQKLTGCCAPGVEGSYACCAPARKLPERQRAGR